MENSDTTDLEDSTLKGVSLDDKALQPTPPLSEQSSSNPSSNLRPPNLHRLRRVIILSLLILILLGAGATGVEIKHELSKPRTVVINTQSLSNSTLNKITSQSGGGPISPQLTISPSTTFKNNVVVQGSGSIQGDTDIGGNLAVKGGASIQGAASTGALSVHGSLGVAGSEVVGGNLSVSGIINAASISVGSITINNLSITGDVGFGGHLVPTGAAPSVQSSVAASGGTTAISGNDTAGTVTINIGSGQTLAGEMAIIYFRKPFSLTPHVQLTPVNSAAATLQYYVSQSPTFFTIRTASLPSNNETYYFNYFVTD